MEDKDFKYNLEILCDTPDCFCGMSTFYTPYDNIVVGQGKSRQQAFDDALEQFYALQDEIDPLLFSDLESERNQLDDSLAAGEYFYYVGIKWSLTDIEIAEGE